MLIVSNKENQSEKSQKEHPEAKERKIEGEKKGMEGGREKGRKDTRMNMMCSWS